MSIVKFNKDTPLQKIKASFLDDTVVLTTKQQEVKEQIRYTYTLRLNNNYSQLQAVCMLQEEYGMSQSTAYRLYQKALFVFGEIDTTDLKAEKRIIIEHKWNLYQLALKKGQIEVANKILNEYAAMFDFTEDNALDEGKLKPHKYNIVITKETKKVLEMQFKEGVADFNTYPSAEEIDYKEVEDGE